MVTERDEAMRSHKMTLFGLSICYLISVGEEEREEEFSDCLVMGFSRAQILTSYWLIPTDQNPILACRNLSFVRISPLQA